jgi:hypothetical protein
VCVCVWWGAVEGNRALRSGAQTSASHMVWRHLRETCVCGGGGGRGGGGGGGHMCDPSTSLHLSHILTSVTRARGSAPAAASALQYALS